MNLSRVVVIVAVTAAIVYAGLNFLLPRGQKSPAVESVAASSEAPATTEAATTAPETAAVAETAEPSSAPAAEVASDDSAAGATAEDPALTEEEARRIAENVASEVATRVAGESAAAGAAAAAEPEPTPEIEADTAEPAAVADAGSSGLTEEQARRIADNVARESAGESSEIVEEPAPAAPEPVAEPAPKRERAAAAAPARSASTGGTPKRVSRDKPNAAPSGKIGNGADVITAWWKTSSGTDRLNLVYAGEASSEKAVVLVFDAAVDAAAAASQIKLLDAKGGTPSGEWTSAGSNPRLIAFKGVTPGRYTVIVGAGMADTSGKSVGSELVGPVYVH